MLAIRLVCIAEGKPRQDTQLKQVGSHQIKIIVQLYYAAYSDCWVLRVSSRSTVFIMADGAVSADLRKTVR